MKWSEVNTLCGKTKEKQLYEIWHFLTFWFDDIFKLWNLSVVHMQQAGWPVEEPISG